MNQRATSSLAKARNSFRPFFNARKPRPFWKEMQTVRHDTPVADYPLIFSVTENNRAYPFPGIGNTFPHDPTFIPNFRFQGLKPLELPRELAFQIARLNHHSDMLSHCLESLARINEYLVRKEKSAVEAELAAHKEKYGLSLQVLKKELLNAVQHEGLPGLARRQKELVGGYQRTGWALFVKYVYDLLDPNFDPGRASGLWLQLINKRLEDRGREWYCLPVQDQILLRSNTPATFASILLRYSGISLLDLALLIWRKRAVHRDYAQLSGAFDGLAQSIKDVLGKSFSELIVPLSAAYRTGDGSYSDIEVFRMSFYFDEIASVANWRAQINNLRFAPLFDHLESDKDSTLLRGTAHELLTGESKMDLALRSLRTWESLFVQPSASFQDQTFLAATLVSESCRKVANGAAAEPTVLTHMLVTTDDIQLYVPMEVLQGLLKSEPATRSKQLVFVLYEMIYRKERNPDNELERRIAFMNMFGVASHEKIVQLLDHTALSDLPTAILMAKTCTRTFLERLYLLMTSVKDVLETRISVCRWLINRVGRSARTLEEEIAALERELANLDARSDLDSTRVHVDEESLKEWFKETQQANVSRYAQTAIAEGPDTAFESLVNVYSSKEKKGEEGSVVHDTEVGSEFILISIFEATLEAFSSDKSFGLDAYLSRRIRHGTLSGYVVTPVSRAIKRWADSASTDSQVDNRRSAILEHVLDDWRKYLVNELDHVRRDVIQLQTHVHPNGLIRANWRTVTNIAHLDAMIARVKGRVMEGGGTYDVFPDIYSLCWDCVESDLAQLRLYMMHTFLPRTSGRLNDLFETLPYEERANGRPHLKFLQETLRTRIQDVCGWFIRPVFRRDRYSLRMLTLSTLSIVRELDDKYAFREDVDISDEISLNRGGFDVFGDVLYVLIHNAARHGKSDGLIKVTGDQTVHGLITVDVTSEVATIEAYNDAILRIKTALDVSDRDKAIADAAVQEGFTGLKKIAGMILRVRGPIELRAKGSPDKLQITFSFSLPGEITFTRRISK